jgi:hypothetical protein
MHSALSSGFTYNGTHYTGDQAAVAQGDNFLSLIVPMIMSSAAYKNSGAIVIWYDETEGGDTKLEEKGIRNRKRLLHQRARNRFLTRYPSLTGFLSNRHAGRASGGYPRMALSEV